TPVDALRVTGKRRAAFGGPIAHGDDVVERLTKKSIQQLRVLALHLEIQQPSSGVASHGMNLGLRRTSGTFDANLAVRHLSEDDLGKLRSRRIAGAQEQHAQWLTSHCESPAVNQPKSTVLAVAPSA